jgi:tetratricopeptide (TPR) repeat protein
MSSNGCLSPGELVRLREGQFDEHEGSRLSQHLQACSVCDSNARLLEGLVSSLAGGRKTMGSAKNGERTAACLTPEITYRYLEKELAEADRIKVEAHLDECSSCYESMVSLLKNSLTPLSELEKDQIRELSHTTPESQVARVLSYLKEGPSSRREESSDQGFWRLQQFLRFPHGVATAWRSPALASLALVALAVVTYQGVRYYHISQPIAQAELILQQNYRVYMKDTARLSGGYRSSGVAALMSQKEEKTPEPSYSDKALALTEEAASHGADPDKVREIEAQIYVIRHDYTKAESLYQQIGKSQQDSSALLNDQGVLCFSRGEWDKAQAYFESSLKANQQFKEAWYNLALVKANRRDTKGALSALERYLTLETDEGWRNAAVELRRRLSSQ